MKKKVVHLIKPDAVKTAAGLIQVFCRLIDPGINKTTTNEQEATCVICRSMSSYKNK